MVLRYQQTSKNDSPASIDPSVINMSQMTPMVDWIRRIDASVIAEGVGQRQPALMRLHSVGPRASELAKPKWAQPIINFCSFRSSKISYPIFERFDHIINLLPEYKFRIILLI